MNFNIVKKPQKKDDEEDFMDEEEIEIEEENKSDNKAKKRMIKFMGFIIIGTIILLLILYVVSLFSNKSYSYSDVEKVLVSAAKSYFKDHPDNLPTEEGDVVEVDATNLIAAGKMKDISEYINDGTTCSATVQVEKSGSSYLYSPFLNCGEEYSTVELYSKIVNPENIVTSGYGLYSVNGSYVFRGEKVNNYVKLGNGMWRIIKVNSNNNIVLISEDGAQYSQPWDDRYNEERLYESGINNYSASRAKEFLDKIYSNPSIEDGEDVLSKSDKSKIVSYNVCTGKRVKTSEVNNNSEECGEVLQNQKMGLLTLSDFINASIDPNCKSASTKSCKNYNYLIKKYDWWLITANKDDNSTVYKVDQSGVIVPESASSYSIVRPVIYLNSKVLYKSGNGTYEKPYKVR